ncbi:protein phosphatase 1 regulatory subunit 36 isoform X4 [Pelodiscus sinensis]|uniref:protein phosphatase 1 regulatory subunit 36 isoform X4 n=1 Tax=Pelodiscus sinensis TaxID=13735 RepID=UPI003F6AB3B1
MEASRLFPGYRGKQSGLAPHGSLAAQPMVKIATGVWYWKEDTQTLEFASSTPATEVKEKLQKCKAIHFQEMGSKTVDRSTHGMFQELFGIQFPEKRTSIREEKSPKLSKRGQNEYITLDDVKYVALFLVQEDESYHIPSFTSIMRTPSVLDQKEREETLAKLEGTKKHLAKVYCILILGLGMAEHHHMACGKRKTSSTQKDREFFECFYNFCTYVAWVVFRRKNFQEIQEEVGRLLRSDIFNPALREKSSSMQKTDVSADQRKVIFPYHRSIYARRPAIKSVVGQRSPVLSTLLPLPKDNAQYLFQNHYLHRGRTLPIRSHDDLPDYSTVDLIPKVGIIGALRSKFNPHTLMPIGVMEEEEEEEEQQRTKRNSLSASSFDLASSSSRGTQLGTSHHSVVLSKATTEGVYSENG